VTARSDLSGLTGYGPSPLWQKKRAFASFVLPHPALALFGFPSWHYFGHPFAGFFFVSDFFISFSQLPSSLSWFGLGPGLAALGGSDFFLAM
jgi:hypothetical protein